MQSFAVIGIGVSIHGAVLSMNGAVNINTADVILERDGISNIRDWNATASPYATESPPQQYVSASEAAMTLSRSSSQTVSQVC